MEQAICGWFAYDISDRALLPNEQAKRSTLMGRPKQGGEGCTFLIAFQVILFNQAGRW